jgi:acetyl coenzyme A synthetase (ADP forming)-like protein
MFFRPRGVAVIGASRDPNKLGHRVMHKLILYHYPGRIYPVNPRAEEILGHPAYPNVTEVPDPVDLAVVVVPAPHVAQALADCGQRGIRGVVIISSGFRETGPEGAKREREIKEIAARHGIRLIGPNCVGVIDTHTPLNATFLRDAPDPGEIGFVSQSGALCAAVISWAPKAGVGFSRVASLGNQAGVTETEMLTTFMDDPNTRVITLYLEAVDNGLDFVETAQRVARARPIVALKAGRGEAGARAVSSHTGALSGQDKAYAAAFRRAGVLRASSMEELFDWARALAWQPLPQGNRVGVLTNAGGLGVLAVDALEAAGLKLAPLTKETRAFLRARTLPAAIVDNPVDILGGSGSGTYALALDALLRDPTVDAVCILQAPQDWFSSSSLAEVVAEVAAFSRKPVLTCIMGLDPADEATVILNQRHIPNYTFPERLGSTLAAMWARQRWLREQEAALAGAAIPELITDVEAAGTLLRGALKDGRSALLPEEARDLMAAYGISTPASGLASTAEAAVNLAEEIGYPVAVKIASADIVHKTEMGGVALNLTDDDAVRAATTKILLRARAAHPNATIPGVLVQQMLSGGAELIVGVTRDSQFGPLVMVGSGGVAVELMRDVAFDLGPLTPAQAARLLDQTSAGPLLDGYRGSPPCDREAVESVIVRLARLAADLPLISEIEINPLIVRPAGQGASAVDVRVLLNPAGVG